MHIDHVMTQCDVHGSCVGTIRYRSRMTSIDRVLTQHDVHLSCNHTMWHPQILSCIPTMIKPGIMFSDNVTSTDHVCTMRHTRIMFFHNLKSMDHMFTHDVHGSCVHSVTHTDHDSQCDTHRSCFLTIWNPQIMLSHNHPWITSCDNDDLDSCDPTMQWPSGSCLPSVHNNVNTIRTGCNTTETQRKQQQQQHQHAGASTQVNIRQEVHR